MRKENYHKKQISIIILTVFIYFAGILFSQEKPSNFPVLKGPYIGQKLPALKPELFAPDFVSVKVGVYGNIVFSLDFKEAAWSPNYSVDDKNISFRDKSGTWQKATNLIEKIGLPEETRFIMMNQARITPNGRYLFFTFFNGKGHMVY